MREKTRPSAANPLAPRALNAFRQAVKDSRLTPADDGVVRLCVVCDDDVSRDAFRLKRGDGYICMDCQDDEADRARLTRKRLGSLRMAAVLLLVLVGLTTFVVSTVGNSPPPAPKTNKR